MLTKSIYNPKLLTLWNSFCFTYHKPHNAEGNMQQNIYTIHDKKDSIATLLHIIESNMQNMQEKNITQYNIHAEVFGMIQGVGFRPFVATLAHVLHLHGFVYNQSGSTLIALHISTQKECKRESILLFYTALLLACKYTINPSTQDLSIIQKAHSILEHTHTPKQAFITSLHITMNTDTAHTQGFHILESNVTQHAIQAHIPLDTKVCESCLKDMRDENSRFYNYPFVACVNCGARYSILHQLPYDRKNTSMSDMALCIDCDKDYKNLANRRFHTEPLSCNNCAIKVEFYRYNHHEKHYDLDAIKTLAKALMQNNIVLFKGLGGFAYIANARSKEALQKVRSIKNRLHKPFVVMANIPTLRTISLLTPQLESLLTSKEAPIVIVPKHPQYNLSNEVSSLQTIGVMIPYTAMLTLLFSYLPPDFAMIYTSANNKGEMIATTLHNLALDRIVDIAESLYILDYNREILNCVDDSILLGIDTTEIVEDHAFECGNELLERNLQNLETNLCHTEPLGEVSKTLESKRDISCLRTQYDKALDSTSTNHANKTTDSSDYSMALDGLWLNCDGRSYLSDMTTHHNSANHSNCIDGGEFLQKLDPINLAHNTQINSHSLSTRAMRISRGFAPLHITSDTINSGNFSPNANHANTSCQSKSHTNNPKITNLNSKIFHLNTLSAAFGAMQKSSIAFGFHNHIIVSPYMGDLFTPYNVANFRKTYDYFSTIYGTPQALIADIHNQYTSTQIAKEIAKDSKIPLFQVAHHHAHFNALLLESSMKGGVGVIFDGSGMGDDGTLWGGEFLCGDSKQVERILHFKPFKILGGEKHIKDCKRLAYSYAICNDIAPLKAFIESSYDENERKALQALHNTGFNSPLCSSVGRLFDIAGFILGLERLSYEAQSGELIASNTLKLAYDILTHKNQIIDYNTLMQTFSNMPYNPYPFHITQNTIDMSECIEMMFKDQQTSKNSDMIAARFIDTLAYCILESLKRIGTDYAFFGGGVFANYALCIRVKKLLHTHNIKAFFPKLPCSDYSISIGQLMYLQHFV